MISRRGFLVALAAVAAMPRRLFAGPATVKAPDVAAMHVKFSESEVVYRTWLPIIEPRPVAFVHADGRVVSAPPRFRRIAVHHTRPLTPSDIRAVYAAHRAEDRPSIGDIVFDTRTLVPYQFKTVLGAGPFVRLD